MPALDPRKLDATYRGKMHADYLDNDHRWYFWYHEGRLVLKTYLSTPFRGTISSNMVSLIARNQLRLGSANKLAELVQCSMSTADWDVHVETYASSSDARFPT